MSSSENILTPHDIAITYGADLVASFVGLFVLGILIATASRYVQKFPNDRLAYKLIVTLIVTMATTSTLITAGSLYVSLINHFGDELYSLEIHWPVKVLVPFIAGTNTILAAFLSFRIYVVSGRTWRIYPLVSFCSTLTGFGISIYIGWWMGLQASTSALLNAGPFIWAWFGCHAFAELMTTGALVYHIIIKPRRKDRDMSQTSSILRKLAVTAVETNMLSLMMQCLVVIIFSQAKSTGDWYNIASGSINSVYAFSLLMALLSRTSEESSFGQTSAEAFSRAKSALSRNHGAVSVHVQQHMTIDSPEGAVLPSTRAGLVSVHWPGEKVTDRPFEKGIELDRY